MGVSSSRGGSPLRRPLGRPDEVPADRRVLPGEVGDREPRGGDRAGDHLDRRAVRLGELVDHRVVGHRAREDGEARGEADRTGDGHGRGEDDLAAGGDVDHLPRLGLRRRGDILAGLRDGHLGDDGRRRLLLRPRGVPAGEEAPTRLGLRRQVAEERGVPDHPVDVGVEAGAEDAELVVALAALAVLVAPGGEAVLLVVLALVPAAVDEDREGAAEGAGVLVPDAVDREVHRVVGHVLVRDVAEEALGHRERDAPVDELRADHDGAPPRAPGQLLVDAGLGDDGGGDEGDVGGVRDLDLDVHGDLGGVGGWFKEQSTA